jgi:hypothetical protein
VAAGEEGKNAMKARILIMEIVADRHDSRVSDRTGTQPAYAGNQSGQ